MKKIHVLCGGKSDERAVSLRSGAAVAKALETVGFTAELLDQAEVGFDKIADCDAVFVALHGKSGEDGVIQTELEKRHISYTGSAPRASEICFDKSLFKRTIQKHDLLIPGWDLVGIGTLRNHPLTAKPFVLKPNAGGSSIDTFIVRDPSQAPWNKMLSVVEERYGEMLLEELITGVELTVGVLGEDALPVIEIVPPADGEFDYENKYNGRSQELCPAVHASEETQQRAQELAKKAHLFTGCRDFSRTDFMCETATGELYMLETNTIPGLTEQSLFPKMAAAAGIGMPELCKQLVEMALSR